MILPGLAVVAGIATLAIADPVSPADPITAYEERDVGRSRPERGTPRRWAAPGSTGQPARVALPGPPVDEPAAAQLPCQRVRAMIERLAGGNRDLLRERWIGRTMAEVRQELGAPGRVTGGDGRWVWVYEARLPVRGRVQLLVTLLDEQVIELRGG